jgi:hypothetical protein
MAFRDFIRWFFRWRKSDPILVANQVESQAAPIGHNRPPLKPGELESDGQFSFKTSNTKAENGEEKQSRIAARRLGHDRPTRG